MCGPEIRERRLADKYQKFGEYEMDKKQKFSICYVRKQPVNPIFTGN
jgi:uncharacterized protein YlbG (UPF0298 family)